MGIWDMMDTHELDWTMGMDGFMVLWDDRMG